MSLKLTSRGMNFAVEVDPRGVFSVEVEGEGELRDKTLDGLREKLDKATKASQKKVAVEFWRWRDEKLEKGLITGIHSSTGNLLVRIKETSSQEYGRGTYDAGRYLRLNAEERTRYTELRKEAERIHKEIVEFEQGHKFDAYEVVKKAFYCGKPDTCESGKPKVSD